MSRSTHPALDLRPTDHVTRVGILETVRRSMRGEIVAVFHRASGWTHLYRVDGRTVHLLRVVEGDRRAELAAIARLDFPIAHVEPDALVA